MTSQNTSIVTTKDSMQMHQIGLTTPKEGLDPGNPIRSTAMPTQWHEVTKPLLKELDRSKSTTSDQRYFQTGVTDSILDQSASTYYQNPNSSIQIQLLANNGTSVNDSKNSFLMLVEDFSDYFYNNFNTNLTFGENSSLSIRSDIFEFTNCTLVNGSLVNGSHCGTLEDAGASKGFEYNYWALILVLFPFLTLFGNVLVILSVYRERTLQTVTNYFIVSLALADLLVAVVVMPFAVYVLVRCLECGSLFCCSDCRRRHESKVHGLVYDCRLCRFDLFTLNVNESSNKEFLEHLSSSHLPLNCVKCGKVYEKMEDLSDGVRCCIQKNEESVNEAEMVHVMKVQSTQNIPVSINVLKQEEISKDASKITKRSKGKLMANVEAEVMTSTPTHPSVPVWGLFQKSFTSTISGIHSPDSDVANNSPVENQKNASVSMVRADSTSNLKGCKEIVMNRVKMLSQGESSEKDSDCGQSPQRKPTLELNLEKENVGKDTPQRFTPSVGNLSDRKRKVTFAEDANKFKDGIAMIKPHLFVKPKRAGTPARLKPKRNRTTRLQAIINNFEARSKLQSTPKNLRIQRQTEENTPPSTEQNINGIMARTIDFKMESPSTSENSVDSPVVPLQQLVLKEKENGAENLILSPVESEASNLDHYKSCLGDSPLTSSNEIVNTGELNCVEDLPKRIAGSIEETLSNALNTDDTSTEIQFTIVITKKIVSVKETKTSVDDRVTGKNNENRNTQKKESTTMWTRLMDGVKWVLWGDKRKRISIEGNKDIFPEYHELSSTKRKRLLSDLSDSPVRRKKYRYSGRISGRRPLDRVLKSGRFSHQLERSSSVGVELLETKTENKNENDVMNQSF